MLLRRNPDQLLGAKNISTIKSKRLERIMWEGNHLAADNNQESSLDQNTNSCFKKQRLLDDSVDDNIDYFKVSNTQLNNSCRACFQIRKYQREHLPWKFSQLGVFKYELVDIYDEDNNDEMFLLKQVFQD
eukprot:TRINITY_DN81488_c0_g1_i1.p2 TRINITY_DN81488_c0_g1~~TRINITY_DN81488_c0_g1_i1.p2  ORF type:complete len:148 (-),score=10.57 TRINITY_DN81488_c0_g1_i1:122-511(-)